MCEVMFVCEAGYVCEVVCVQDGVCVVCVFSSVYYEVVCICEVFVRVCARWGLCVCEMRCMCAWWDVYGGVCVQGGVWMCVMVAYVWGGVCEGGLCVCIWWGVCPFGSVYGT